MNVPGARVLVIGGVRRLGRVIALDLAVNQASVCVSTRRAGPEADAQVAALRAAGAASASVIPGDVGTATEAAELVRAAARELGGLDALVFCASGPFAPAPPQDIDEPSWDSSVDIVAKGFFFAAVTARDLMLGEKPPAAPGQPAAAAVARAENGPGADAAGSAGTAAPRERGVIVALTDLLGTQPWAAFAAHGAAKAAQIHLVKELALAWKGDGVRVCGVAPGPVDLDDDEHRAATLRAAGDDREKLTLPADVAAAVRFCLTTPSLTGVNIPVDKGSLLRW